MKKIVTGFFLLSLLTSVLYTQDNGMNHTPQIAIMDIMSSSFSDSDVRLFTDILRTEIFKLNHFKIVERGVIQQIIKEQEMKVSGLVEDSTLLEIGKLLAVEKLLVCRIDSLGETTAFNIRLIDVESSLLDFTENVFIKDENMIFDAIKDIVLKIELYYVVMNEDGTPENRIENVKKKWYLLGASDEDLQYLLKINAEPEKYLEIRQYDITFKLKDYIEILDRSIQPETIKLFFQNGIPYDQVKEALSYGIVDLKNYKEQFLPLELSFKDYLNAYSKHVVSATEYLEYKKGYRKNRLILGAGGVANDFPIINSDFKFFMVTVAWEYFYSDYQRGITKYSSEVGINLMNLFLPSPYFQFNAYAGTYPFYGKLSLGVLAEVFIGGHFGLFARAGIEVNSTYEVNLIMIFTGTQPNMSYTDPSTPKDEPGYIPINFPYFGAVFVYKY